MVFDRLPKPAIIAHRGASAHAPENTLAAFQRAVQEGADGIELDVMLTADRQVVVIHDTRVERTTNGSGQVAAMTLAGLKQLDAGSWFDGAFMGEKIPGLDEVFHAVGQKTAINIELKNYQSLWDDLPEKTARIVQKHALEQSVFFSSFNPAALWKIKKLLPNCPIGLLTTPGRFGRVIHTLGGAVLQPQALHPHYSRVNSAYVQAARDKSYRIMVWTVNQPEEMLRLAELGVDGIITDDPALAQITLGR